MLALQRVSPVGLTRAMPAVTLAEARKIAAQVQIVEQVRIVRRRWRRAVVGRCLRAQALQRRAAGGEGSVSVT